MRANTAWENGKWLKTDNNKVSKVQNLKYETYSERWSQPGIFSYTTTNLPTDFDGTATVFADSVRFRPPGSEDQRLSSRRR